WLEDQFRVNDVVFTEQSITVFHCNDFPYFPCPNKVVMSKTNLPKELKIQLEAALPIIQLMKNNKVVALIKSAHGTRAIIDGQADNEIGIFVASKL
ncbi:hypothetical protein ABTM68_19065, partial [Acinetobacter baumannii]